MSHVGSQDRVLRPGHRTVPCLTLSYSTLPFALSSVCLFRTYEGHRTVRQSEMYKYTQPALTCSTAPTELFLRIDVLLFFLYNKSKEYLRIQERMVIMNLAKISANGQITVPVEIRRLLGLKSGDKILFLQKSNGDIVINNASAQAIYKAQRAFAGVAEEIGIYDEDDAQKLVNEVRYGKGK